MKKQLYILFAFVVTLASCGGSVSKNNKDAAQLATDSLALVNLFNKEIKVGENVLTPIPTEVVELSNSNCRLYVWLPEDRQGGGAQSLGVDKCTEAVKWLAENGYDLSLNGVYVSCYVYSKFTGGVTSKDGMVTKWGHARYDPTTDMVDWKPAK